MNAIISMFSSDLLNLYTQLLYKISHDHEQPHLHTATFIGQRGATIISILQPVISSLHVLLEAVIRCRDTEYQDLTIVPALLRTHTLLSVVPNSSSYYQQARDTTASLVTCLLTFTSPNVDLTKNKVSKSLWTMMVAEVLNYIVSSPAVLKSGLELLSQLLPLPLPIPSNRELTEEEVTNVSTSRKLWSAHLHPLSSQISKLLGVASSYSHPPVVSLLQKIVDQLASLSPPSALLLITAMVGNIKEAEAGDPLSQQLDFLCWSLAQSNMKTVMSDKMSTDETFRTQVMATLDHVVPHYPEHVVQLVHHLCDPDNSMSDSDSPDQLLADTLPNKDTMLLLTTCLLDLLSSDSKHFTSHTKVLATLKMLTDNWYTCDVVKSLLLSHNKDKTLFCFLRKLAVEFDASNSELIRCTTALLSFILHLHKSDARQDAILSLEEIGVVLGWLSQDDNSQQAAERRRTHPLVVLTNRIKESESVQPDLNLTNTSVSQY